MELALLTVPYKCREVIQNEQTYTKSCHYGCRNGQPLRGLKQIEPVDPEGHIIIDFSLFDAWRAGFRDVVFIIKREMEGEFRACIGDRMKKILPCVLRLSGA